ncbi:hypothetical protein V502_05917 [Pseudogymnoascus sp. VKM F-4520 (FW-2644)]|nr:hypothetical protein V502_05917 [Pseudogymnoascus sp. VKM F-4520 (FW-2644)]
MATAKVNNLSTRRLAQLDTINYADGYTHIMDWAKQKCSSYYDSSWRWIEDTYLAYFGENRTSYGIKESLKKTEVTGDENVDGIQRGVGGAVGDVFSSKGPAGVVGGGVDKGILRGNV